MRTLRRVILVLGAALLLTQLPRLGGPPSRPADDPFASELARLERWRGHAPEGSAERFKIDRRIGRLERRAAGRPAFDEPDQFARILNEMRIPADRREPDYEAGYRVRELDAARKARATKATPLAWEIRGPGNVAGRARGIVVDPDDPTNRTWFIASVGGGVWKTTDAGATWSALTDDFPVLSVQSLAMAPSDHDVMYAGTGESFYNVDTINGNGILKTTDRGVTWTHLPQTIDNPAFNNVARIVVDPADANVVLAATTVGRYKESVLPRSSIFKSIDGGQTWTEVHAVTDIGTFNRVKKIQQIAADPTNFNVLYATVDEGGILKSVNAGNSWNWINTGIADFTGRFELAISPVNTSRLYAAAEGASHSELWISTNGGASWSETFESGTEPNWLGAQGWYDNTIVCHPTNANIVYVGGIRLWQITLSGTSRASSQLATGPVHVDQHGLVVLNDGGGAWRLLNTNDGGVGLSSSAATGWTAPIDGMVSTQFYGIDKRPGASAYFGGMQDNGTWFSPIDAGALTPWTSAIGGDGYETSWHFNDPLKMIGGFQYNGLRRSLDGGQTWTTATNGLLDTGSARAPFITKIAKTNAAPDFLCAVGRDGVWRSLDFGGTWTLAAIPAAAWGAVSSFHDVKISRANPQVVWGGARMDATVRIHVSTNGAVSFAPTADYPAATMGGISGLATHPTQPNTAYVLFSFAGRPKILRTTDLGATWTDITGFAGGSPSTNGFPDVAVYDLLVFSDDPNRLWAGTEIGLVESLDGGATWALADNGLPAVSIWDLAEVEDEVVVGTHGRGIWSVKFPSLVAGRTFRPLLDALYQAPSGQLNVDLNLRSPYDSTVVYVNGARAATLPASGFQQDAVVQVPVLVSGTKDVFARSWRGGVPYDSVTRSVAAYALQAPRFAYENDFETAGSDFALSGFRVGTESGFAGSALHSQHPYADNSGPTALLTVPVRVALSNAYVEFDEVALVEPGDPGSVFGDASFWDYVIVEGTRDGVTWLPIEDGWDCRRDAAWETAYNSSAAGTSALLRHHVLDLHGAFAWNETILLRFRLYADASANGWGWVVDNLRIQVGSPTDVPDGAAPRLLAMAQNAPNPFNPSTRIRYELPREGRVELRVFDVRGRLVRTLLDGVQPAGTHVATWDGRLDDGGRAASGVYVCRLKTGDEVRERRMTLVK